MYTIFSKIKLRLEKKSILRIIDEESHPFGFYVPPDRKHSMQLVFYKLKSKTLKVF